MVLPAVVMVVIASELAYRLGHRTVPPGGTAGGCAVLVPGYPTRSDGSPHPVQRMRVQAAVEAYRNHRCSRIVLSGGAVANRHAEAETMAEIAAELGVPRHALIVEKRSRTTWENIGCSAGYLTQAEHVLIVSDSLHVHRALRYGCRQSAVLCPKLTAIGVLPPRDLFWWKLPAAVHELGARMRDALLYERRGATSAPPCPTG